MSTINLTQTVIGLRSGLCGDRPVNNHLALALSVSFSRKVAYIQILGAASAIMKNVFRVFPQPLETGTRSAH